MSPTASTQHSIDPARRASISRPSPTSRQSPIPAPPPSTSIHYTVLIRLPFARNGFVDPEPVSWDATKDKALWKLISKASNSKDLDWEAIAERFEVGLGFLMQQAAWLYERHFEGMREQMRKLSTVAVPEGGVAMRREGSRDSQRPSLDTQRPLITSLRKEAQQTPESSSPGTPKLSAPGFSRTPSTTTITQSRLGAGQTSSFRQRSFRPRGSSQDKRSTTQRRSADAEDEDVDRGRKSYEGPSESEHERSLARSQAYRRQPGAPQASASRPALGRLSSEDDPEHEDEEDDDPSSSGGYLPFATAAGSSSGQGPAAADPAATLRSSPKRGTTTTKPISSSSTSSASSSTGRRAQGPKPGPISPQHRAQLTQQSPHSTRHRSRGGGETAGSESAGTPSMGSSFSDLEDASVTQSALEEALMSNLQAGGGSMASRVSGLSRAFGGSRQM